VSVALDITQVIVPGVFALGGGYYGARWQAKSAADMELPGSFEGLPGVNVRLCPGDLPPGTR
jgi:hypothetical protein